MSVKIVKKGIYIRRIYNFLKEIKEFKRFYLLALFIFLQTYNVEELKTFTISESVKMKREQREQRNKEYEDKLKVLKEKTDQLKKDLGY